MPVNWEKHRPPYHLEGYAWLALLPGDRAAELILYERNARILVSLAVWAHGHKKLQDVQDELGFATSDTIIYCFEDAAKKWAENILSTPMDMLAEALNG